MKIARLYQSLGRENTQGIKIRIFEKNLDSRMIYNIDSSLELGFKIFVIKIDIRIHLNIIDI